MALKLKPPKRPKPAPPPPEPYKGPETRYGKWPNGLMEKLIEAKLNGPQYRMALWIGRYTIGYSRARVPVRMKELAEQLRMHKSQASRAVTVLVDLGAVLKTREAGQIMLGLNPAWWN